MPNVGTILLVEDDEAQREVVTEVLEYEGYRVLTAETTAEALDSLDEFPDVVLLDLRGISSRDVMASVEQRTPRPVVVLVSGDSRLRETAELLRADDFLGKPYDLQSLIETVSDAMASSRQRQHSGLESAPA